MPNQAANSTYKYRVAIDFGSESMAACFFGDEDNWPVEIQLQARAKELSAFDENLLDLLYENRPGRPRVRSPRLRTRIVVRDSRLASTPLSQQAVLDFASSYGNSAFEYFHTTDQVFRAPILPNPKLLYQSAASALLPQSLLGSTPEEILQATIVQIINNLVLTDPALNKDADLRLHRRLRGADVILLLTVPNVYSTSHAEKLREFVASHARTGNSPVAGVEIVYESDAIAHYLMYRAQGPPEGLSSMFGRIGKSAEARRIVNVITFDVGRGTTDVSFTSYDFGDGMNRVFSRKARTGRAQGGAHLSFLFARYFDERIDEAVASFRTTNTTVAEAIPSMLRLTHCPTPQAPELAVILPAAEKLVEIVKRGLDSSLKFSTEAYGEVETATRDLAAALTQPVVNELSRVSAGSPHTSEVQRLQEHLRAALFLPRRLPTMTFPRGMVGKLPAAVWKRIDQSQSKFSQWMRDLRSSLRLLRLTQEIRQYVKENVNDIFEWMLTMARATEGAATNKQLIKGVKRGADTFVVVAGQASQFKPLHTRIRAQVKKLEIQTGGGTNLVYLAGVDAKYACCRGAVLFHRTGIIDNNPSIILGTYGFLGQAADRALENLDMAKFADTTQEQTVDLTGGHHHFVFQARHFPKGPVTGATLDSLVATSDSLAYVCMLRNGGQKMVRLLGGVNGIEIRGIDASGVPEILNSDTAGYGEATGGLDRIYMTTWPDVVRSN